MMNNTPKSSKSNGGKQPDLRQFMVKRMKPSEGNSCSSPAPLSAYIKSETDDSLTSPSIVVHQNQDVDMGISGSINNTVALEEDEEWLYDAELLPHDPGKRISIMDYPPKLRNAVRRAYILKEPCQPLDHQYPQRELGGVRRFSVSWFKKWDWLEYSIEKDAAFCFVCYLFKNEIDGRPGGDAFVNGGFRSWNKPDRFSKHAGGVKSAHNLAYEKYVNLRDSLKKAAMSDLVRREHELHLKTSLSCMRFLLCQGWAFPDHAESDESYNGEIFLELLKWLGEKCEDVKSVTFENVPMNYELISPMIQKDLINCCAKETTKCMIEELGDDCFGILASELIDVFQKEQLVLVLRYVDKQSGKVVERFLGIVHVSDGSALSFKEAIMSLLMAHSLNPSMIRGQGYDGASNMKGEVNGLKTLIMNDNPRAYYVHCFAHQLPSTLVAVVKKNDSCGCLFEILAKLSNLIGDSCKKREMIQASQVQKVAQALNVGELESRSRLKRPESNRWGSYYKSLLNIINLFPTIVEVLVHIGKHDSSDDKFKAQFVLGSLETFEFVFMAHFMLTIFGYTNDLCISLQKREQDIVNAMELVSYTRSVLQKMRDHGWEALLKKITLFCTKDDIVIPSMDASYVPEGRSSRFVEQTTNLQYFQVEVFVGVINLLLHELDNRFNERNMELLTCMACLSPKDNFSSFNKEKVLKLATFYPDEFSSLDVMVLELQLDIYLENMLIDDRFRDLHDLNSLSMKLVETNRHKTYPLIFLLIKLMLVLPVAKASVERVSTTMTYVKSKLQNSMGDQVMNDCLVTYIEKDVFLQVPDETIIDCFKNLRTRELQL